MEDEQTQREVDGRIRAALTPADADAHRVTRRALASSTTRRRTAPYLRYALAVVALTVMAAGAWQWRRMAAPGSPSLSLVGRGSTVLVERADGQRWLVAPQREPRASGNYVIVLTESGTK